MSKKTDISKLIKKIKDQDFKSTEDLKSFINALDGEDIFDFTESTDNKERSQDLIYEALEQPLSKAKKTVKKALELDPDNAEAYNYLARKEKDIDKAIKLYKKAIIAGENTLGLDFFKEEKGYFWGMIESRPYMRAKAGLANCLVIMNEIEKAIDIYDQMLELNPNDNQGIRYILSALYIKTNSFKKFNALNKKYEEYENAVSNFNIALSLFKQEKQSEKANKSLLNAHTQNPYVIDFLLGNKKMPKNQPDYIGVGDKDEALAYVFENYQIWEETTGAFEWIFHFMKNRVKMN